MKIITFYSEKGGVGKSSFTMLYASWLQDKYGVNVGVADFNYRIAGYRRSEIYNREKLRKADPSIPSLDESKTWPIVQALFRDVEEYEKNGDNFPFASWLEDCIRYKSLKGKDVVLCDFPGSIREGQYMQCMMQRKLNLVVTPIDRDEQTVQSTVTLHNINLKYKQNHCIFINRAQLSMKNMKGYFYKLAERLISKDFPLLPDMVSNTDKMLAIDKVDIIRSTFAYPDFSENEAGDYGFENLFIDITRELARCPDIKGTPKADLSFVDGLEKKDDGRQLHGTPYAKYEI